MLLILAPAFRDITGIVSDLQTCMAIKTNDSTDTAICIDVDPTINKYRAENLIVHAY